MENINKDIGQRIKAIRTKKGLTQTELGEIVGVEKATVSKYESGETKVSPEALIKIAKECGKSLDWLMTGKELHDPEQDPDYRRKVEAINQLAAERIAKVLSELPQDQADKVRSVLYPPEGTHKVTAETKIGWNNQPTDLTLVKQIIQAALEHLADHHLTMPPDKFAELVEVLYEEMIESGVTQVNKGTVARMIKLAR